MTTPSAGFEASDANPTKELFASLYKELQHLAHARLKRSEPITLLDTTSLVHETFLRLVNTGQFCEQDRIQFLSYAAHAMRSIIVDAVRRHSASRRGGPQNLRVGEELAESVATPEAEILRVSSALDELAKVDARLVRSVELRYFAGLTESQIAEALGIHARTVRRDLQKARLLLSVALQ